MAIEIRYVSPDQDADFLVPICVAFGLPLPVTPERVLRALEKKAQGPRTNGKWVIFDEDISVNTFAAEGSRFHFPVGA